MKPHLAFALKLQTSNLIRNVSDEIEGLTKTNAHLYSQLEHAKRKESYSNNNTRTSMLETSIKKNLNESKRLTEVLENFNNALSSLSED